MLRKIAEIKVPKGAGPREAKTNPIFATYDRQGAAFAFFFSDSNIAGAAANLLFMVDGQKVFVDDGVTLGETNETHTFTYPLPDKLLNYTGKVDGYLYFDFEDGSHSDEIHFVFTIKKSQIDETMEDAPDVYIKSFEEVKADVQSTADKATSDIKSHVDAVENAKNSTVGDIEKAKDDAESQIGDYVGEVESAKDTAVEDIDKALPEVEDKLDEVAGKISELDISDTNLLLDSAKLKSGHLHQKNPSQGEHSYLNVGKSLDDLSSGTTITISFDIETTDLGVENMRIYNTNKNGPKAIDSRDLANIPAGKTRQSVTTIVRDNDNQDREDSYIEFFSKYDTGQLFEVTNVSINLGSYAHEWKPNPYEIVTQDQYDKLANAIINLGGSI